MLLPDRTLTRRRLRPRPRLCPGAAVANGGGSACGREVASRALVTHADEVAPQVIDRGELRGTRRRLGAAAGAVRTGLSRYGLAAGERAMPVHVHADEEELFVVLAGSGLSWQDGATYAVGAGDVVV